MTRTGPTRRTVAAALAAGLGCLTPASRAGAYDDFFRAIELDNASSLESLLARGLDPNILDPKGHNGLFLALRGGAAKAFRVLLAHPQIQVDQANASGETPLMMAALRANIDAMRALIERGAQVRRDGWTPLHYAASSPSAQAVQLLLDHGAVVDARAPNGNTPLMLAARWGTDESTRLLLRRGADRRLRNERGLDAADYARLDGREAAARLVESGSP